MKVVCGVGNPLRRDDGVGLKVAELLQGEFEVVFCETYPERFLDEICSKGPEEVIIVDGGEFGARPGEFREIAPEQVDSHTISTHTLPLSLFAGLLSPCCERIRIFLIQIKDVGFGEGLSPEVEEGARRLAEYLRRSP